MGRGKTSALPWPWPTFHSGPNVSNHPSAGIVEFPRPEPPDRQFHQVSRQSGPPRHREQSRQGEPAGRIQQIDGQRNQIRRPRHGQMPRSRRRRAPKPSAAVRDRAATTGRSANRPPTPIARLRPDSERSSHEPSEAIANRAAVGAILSLEPAYSAKARKTGSESQRVGMKDTHAAARSQTSARHPLRTRPGILSPELSVFFHPTEGGECGGRRMLPSRFAARFAPGSGWPTNRAAERFRVGTVGDRAHAGSRPRRMLEMRRSLWNQCAKLKIFFKSLAVVDNGIDSILLFSALGTRRRTGGTGSVARRIAAQTKNLVVTWQYSKFSTAPRPGNGTKLPMGKPYWAATRFAT